MKEDICGEIVNKWLKSLTKERIEKDVRGERCSSPLERQLRGGHDCPYP